MGLVIFSRLPDVYLERARAEQDVVDVHVVGKFHVAAVFPEHAAEIVRIDAEQGRAEVRLIEEDVLSPLLEGQIIPQSVYKINPLVKINRAVLNKMLHLYNLLVQRKIHQVRHLVLLIRAALLVHQRLNLHQASLLQVVHLPPLVVHNLLVSPLLAFLNQAVNRLVVLNQLALLLHNHKKVVALRISMMIRCLNYIPLHKRLI